LSTTSQSTITTPERPTPRDDQDALLGKARRLGEIARELGLETLADTIETDTRRRLEDAKVRVLVIGEIKQGKSTLINAIIGREALPVGVTPTTGAVVLVHAGDEPGRYLDHGDGEREVLPEDRFAELARGKPKGGKAANVEGTLELVLPSEVLPPWLELVDTPGINDIEAFRGAVSRGELPRADVLVLVLDATQLLNRSELAFLRDAVAAVGGLDDSGARLLIAINRIDLVDDKDRPALIEHLDGALGALARPRGDGAPIHELFLTNARAAARDPESEDDGVVAVAKLRERLLELAEGRSTMLPARARAALRRHAQLSCHNASIAARALTLEEAALQREIAHVQREIAEANQDLTQIRAKISRARETLLEQSQERTQAFRTQLHKSVTAVVDIASLRTLATHLPGSIHDAYLAFAHEESERLRIALDEITRDAIHTHNEQARRRLFRAALRLGFSGPTIYVDPPSVVFEAGLVAIGVAGTAVMYFGNMVAGMLMTIAGPLATVVLRERSLRDARERAMAELPGALDRATEGVRAQIRGVVDGHLAALDEHLALANIALGEQLAGVLRRVAESLAMSPEEASSEAIARRRAEAQGRLGALERELEQIIADLGD
jgi:signal recognition particle receptor subunit beta